MPNPDGVAQLLPRSFQKIQEYLTTCFTFVKKITIPAPNLFGRSAVQLSEVSYMRTLPRSALSVGAASALLAGCGASSPPVSMPVEAAYATRAAMNNTLLYASSDDGTLVSIYTFPQGKLVMSFDPPGGAGGLCSDKKGDVFIAEPFERIIGEYPHGSAQPIATFEFKPNPYVTPNSCAFDDTTRELAVANQTGSVGVFNLGSGAVTMYTYAGIEKFFFCTYDAEGNLFASAQAFSGNSLILELSHGSSQLMPVRFPFTINTPVVVQWDGTYLAVNNAFTSHHVKITRLAVQNYRAKVKDTVILKGQPPYASEFWIQGDALFCPDQQSDNIAWWKYPAGGKPEHTIRSGNSYNYGVTLSAAK
jgi:hypothetical protein